MSQVSAESRASQQGQPEENNIDRAPGPAADRYSAVTPPTRYAASLHHELPDVR